MKASTGYLVMVILSCGVVWAVFQIPWDRMEDYDNQRKVQVFKAWRKLHPQSQVSFEDWTILKREGLLPESKPDPESSVLYMPMPSYK